MPRGEHQRVIGLPAVCVEDVLGDRHRGCGEVDALNMVFEDAVGGDDEQVAWADRNLMRGQRVGNPVAHDATGQQGRRPDLHAPGPLGTIDQEDTLCINQLRDTLATKDFLQVDNLTKRTTFTVRHQLSSRQVNDVLAGGLIPRLAQEEH